MVQEDQQVGLLTAGDEELVLEAGPEDGAEEVRKVVREFLDGLPDLDVFAEFFVEHYDDGHEVRMGGSGCVVGPQVVFEVLAVFQDHYSASGEAEMEIELN